MCSTPFGVEGSITRGSPRRNPSVAVLNAFRRRRFHHLLNRLDRGGITEVLNAFRRRRFHPLLTRRDRGGITEVLNAFRRRRFHHRRRGCAASCRWCAQRLSASKVPSHVPASWRVEVWMCSTPFGVEGSITGGREQ